MALRFALETVILSPLFFFIRKLLITKLSAKVTDLANSRILSPTLESTLRVSIINKGNLFFSLKSFNSFSDS